MNFIDKKKQDIDAHIIFVFEDTIEQGIHALPSDFFQIENPLALTNYKGKKNQIALLYSKANTIARRLLIVSLGKKERIPTWNALRQKIREATGTVARYARSQNLASCAFVQDSLLEYALEGDKYSLYSDIAYATHASLYTYSLKSKQDDSSLPLLYFAGNENEKECIEKALAKGNSLGKASSFVRNLVNGPANIVTPEYILKKAHEIGKEHKLNVSALNRQDIQNQGLGAFTSVAQGSETEPYLILLEHCPQGKEKEAPLAIVGKGLVFDTGGISLKPANNMHEMKADMAGAATALGLASLLSDYCNRRVIIALACAENMPSGTATRPGDIVTTLSGKTVEILNTDAEGRLVLCDTLTYVQNTYKPSTVIDMATLTGACAMALGEELTGLFTDDDSFARLFKEAGRCSGQEVWRLPLMEDMFIDDITSTVADLQNIGKSRYAGATTAALFLKQFIQENVRYAHLDIAGTAYASIKNPLTIGSATAAPLAMLFTLITELLPNE